LKESPVRASCHLRCSHQSGKCPRWDGPILTVEKKFGCHWPLFPNFFAFSIKQIILRCKSVLHNIIAMFSLKSLHHGRIQTQIFRFRECLVPHFTPFYFFSRRSASTPLALGDSFHLRPIFRTFFSAENSVEFVGKKQFFETFSAEISNFFQHFFGGKFSPEKMYEKLVKSKSF
jgi:hypothetical protein